MLSERSVCANTVYLDATLHDNLGVNPIESRGHQGGILVQKTFIQADARDIHRVCTGDATDAVDAGVKRVERSPGECVAARELSRLQGAAE